MKKNSTDKKNPDRFKTLTAIINMSQLNNG